MSHQEGQVVTKNITPYEKFLRDAIEDSKKQLDELYNEFAKANSIRKRGIKREIATVNQNIELTTRDLQKYIQAMSWLREPTKERDEKAEEMNKVPVDEEKAAVPPPAKPPTPAAPGAAPKPVVSTPATAQPRPTSTPVVGTPKPATVGTPMAKPVPPKVEEKKESEEKKELS